VLAKAEPKTLRYRLLHVAARLIRSGPPAPAPARPDLALAAHLSAAFDRCAALPQPRTLNATTATRQPEQENRQPRPGNPATATPENNHRQDQKRPPRSLINDWG
jgi:hypothetical protein